MKPPRGCLCLFSFLFFRSFYRGLRLCRLVRKVAVISFTCTDLEYIHCQNYNNKNGAEYDGQFIELLIYRLPLGFTEKCFGAAGNGTGKMIVLAALKQNYNCKDNGCQYNDYTDYKFDCHLFFLHAPRVVREFDLFTHIICKNKIALGLARFWWAIRDSNPGPTGYEPVALTN